MDCVAANSDSSKSSRKLLFLAVEFSEKSLKEFTKKLLKDYIGKTCSSLERAFDLVQKKTIEFEFIICDSRSAASRLDLVEIIGLKHNVLVIIVLDEDEALKMAITVGLRNGAFYCFTTPEDVGKIPSLLSGKRTAPASGRNDDEASGSGLKDCKDGDNSGGIDSYTTPRKKRIVWTDKLHAEFIHAIEKLRKDKEKISPKRILQVMKNSDVTRGQVASHLQKYRLQKGINMQEDSVEYHQNDDVPQPTVQISSTAAAAVEPTGSWVVGNSQTGGGYEGPSSMAVRTTTSSACCSASATTTSDEFECCSTNGATAVWGSDGGTTFGRRPLVGSYGRMTVYPSIRTHRNTAADPATSRSAHQQLFESNAPTTMHSNNNEPPLRIDTTTLFTIRQTVNRRRRQVVPP